MQYVMSVFTVVYCCNSIYIIFNMYISEDLEEIFLKVDNGNIIYCDVLPGEVSFRLQFNMYFLYN